VKSSRLECIITKVDCSIIAEVYLSKIQSDVYMNRLSASGYSFDINYKSAADLYQFNSLFNIVISR
jgi:hypothetical protein